MAYRKFSNEEKLEKLRQVDSLRDDGWKVAAASHEIGIHSQTYYRWKKDVKDGEARPGTKAFLEEENSELRCAVVDLTVENQRLKGQVSDLSKRLTKKEDV